GFPDRDRVHLLARRRARRAAVERILPRRVQHRGPRPRAHVAAFLAPHLRARAGKPRRGGGAGAPDLVTDRGRPAERSVAVTVGGRLDAVVRTALPGLSRRLVRSLIAEGLVRIDGHRAAKGGGVPAGAVVTVPALEPRPAPEPALDVPIVHEDEHLVVLDKPGGMPAHALDPRERGTVAAFVLARYPETAGVGDPLAPGLVHRLDTGTSGLLLAARARAAHRALRAALRARAVEKRYLAWVAGDASALDGARVALPLAHDP